MKKKGIATLALAGALAVSMMPAFAASNKTTVGYTANGNASTAGDVMVTVPKNVTFTDNLTTVTGFNVMAYTWDASANNGKGGWGTPGVSTAPALDKTIKVKVDSTNTTQTDATSFILKTTDTKYQSTEGAYQYKVDGSAIKDNVAGNVGTLNSSAHTIVGELKMTVTPVVPQDAGYVYFSDTLTYTFNGLNP